MKTYRIDEIRLPAPCDISKAESRLKKKAAKLLHISENDISGLSVIRHSVDARKKSQVLEVFSVAVTTAEGVHVRGDHPEYRPRVFEVKKASSSPKIRPVVCGLGPAGLFAGYTLALAGWDPIIIERGRPVEQRQGDVEEFFRTGVLDTQSNVQFGEGGAGAFSDGKLNTRIKDTTGMNAFVLDTFIRFGAPEEIRYEAMPHVGTDVLSGVISGLREEIKRLGGAIRYECLLSDIVCDENGLTEIVLNDSERIPCDRLILACGHSARDTFAMLRQRGASMRAKEFAVGLRVEHPQSLIDRASYGENLSGSMPASPYKLTYRDKTSGRGVYSFCMCPGGFVVDSSSEKGMLCVNGMSYSKRDSGIANSAIVVSVGLEDFGGSDPLSGVEFQRRLEKKAFELAGGHIPQQLFADFKHGADTLSYGGYSSLTKGKSGFGRLDNLFSEDIKGAFIQGMSDFGNKIPGFDREDAILSGVEARTSSPVRIDRDEEFLSNIRGLYPCGEGAGYAGGIMSAAVDGIKTAKKVIDGADN